MIKELLPVNTNNNLHLFYDPSSLSKGIALENNQETVKRQSLGKYLVNPYIF